MKSLAMPVALLAAMNLTAAVIFPVSTSVRIAQLVASVALLAAAASLARRPRRRA